MNQANGKTIKHADFWSELKTGNVGEYDVYVFSGNGE